MDSTGLARWSYMTFSGKEENLTTVLVGYNPCRTSSSQHSTSYQIQRAYWTIAKNDITCPRKKFLDDLLSILIKWRTEGRRLVICLDAKKHVYTGCLGRSLVSHTTHRVRSPGNHARHNRLTPNGHTLPRLPPNRHHLDHS
jgi:hypothetical protein